ncbi:MAG: dihydroorotate dehydrogenase electron transfer subunit [Oscillospiraceae bacterium]|nr:MAG: dihydroorotate dehydrogenase electron transfer subunit [Oscillospiraceae bacterium]
MKQVILTIAQSAPIARGTVRTVLSGDTSAITRPGQFINILLDNKYLRRPLSVCDCVKGENGSVTVIYKIVGEGTLKLSRLPAGTRLDVLIGLGNGYDTAPAGESPLLIGGGAGVPPMYMLCRELISLGKSVQVIAGWNSADEAFYTEEFRALGASLTVATVDGTMGIKGLVTDAMKNMKYSYIYACGPLPMLKAVDAAAASGGQLSFEERMGCGFGACMGCSCKTKYGYKRICRDGPVLTREEIIW